MNINHINPHLLKKELWENKSKHLLSTLILGLIAVLSVITYNGGIHTQDLSYNQYIWNNYSAGILPQLGAVVAIVMGMGSFSLERARGTILFLLNTPLSRDVIFCTKTSAGLILLCSALLVFYLLVFLSSRLFDFPIIFGALVAVFFLNLMGVIFIFQLTILFSVLSTDPVKAGLASASCCFLFYGAGLFKETRFISPFYYMGGGTYLDGGEYPWVFLPLMFFFSIALYILAQHFWRKLEV